MKRLLMPALVLTITMLFTACSDTGTKSDTPEKSSPAAISTPAAASPQVTAVTEASPKTETAKSADAGKQKPDSWVKVDKAVDFQDANYKVNAIKKLKGSLISADDGKVFLLIDMVIKNNSKEEMPVSSVMLFDLEDSTGTKHDISIGGLVVLDEEKITSLDGSINAGEEMKGGLAYEIPEKATGLKLTIKSILGSKETVIELDK